MAPSNLIPSSGNYAILETDQPGSTPLTTVVAGNDATFNFSTAGGPILTLDLRQNGNFYMGAFLPMSPLAQLQNGYYPHLKEIAGANRAYGGLSWDTNGEACGATSGWMAVDAISWSGTTLAAVDLRFGCTCGTSPVESYGQIHWVGP
jgi:hypothetical protein